MWIKCWLRKLADFQLQFCEMITKLRWSYLIILAVSIEEAVACRFYSFSHKETCDVTPVMLFYNQRLSLEKSFRGYCQSAFEGKELNPETQAES